MQFHDDRNSAREIFLGVISYVESTCRFRGDKICLYREETRRKRVFPSAIQPRIPEYPEEGNVRGLWIYSDSLSRWKYRV